MDDPPAAPTLQTGCQDLEQFLLLAKSATGRAAVELVNQVLEAPGVYVFGELLETDCLKQLAEGPYANYVQLLRLFAYGTYKDYKREESSLPPLSLPQLMKLKHLSIISLAAKCRTIPYALLLEELDIQNLRSLEDLVIEAIYAGLIQGKLDQRNALLEVECFIGRDIKMEELGGMVDTLQNWCLNCASLLELLESEMSRADRLKGEGVREKEKHEAEVKQLVQTLKVATGPPEMEDPSSQLRDGLGEPFPSERGMHGNSVKLSKK